MAIRVLMIDDSSWDQELARAALTAVGEPIGPVHLTCAKDWAEAEPLVAAGGLDLILLDYNLPGLSGLEILHELAGRPHAPVIMMTGQDDVATAVETLRAGALDYVPKAMEWGTGLRHAIERVVTRVRLERELTEVRARVAAYAADLEQKVSARTAVVRAQAAEIEEVYLKAEEATRVKEELVGNVSHELRTPLIAILGFTEMLEEHVSAGSEGRELLDTVRKHAVRLHELIESLLALRRLNTGSETVSVRPFRLADLADELRATTEALDAAKELAVEWHVPPEPAEVVNDREKIRTIAYHLLSNALKFTHAGRVDVTLEGWTDGGIRLVVRDTGIGMPPGAQAVVFEDFRQLDGSTTRRYEGLGLGLGIVGRYVRLLGGTVRIESVTGSGTTIAVEVPVPATPSHRAPPAVS